MTIDIIGAGIGGLTTAIGLKQKGFETRVFEQAEIIRPVGAGIILANNAMQVYDKLGLKEAIEAKGNAVSFLNITNPELNSISRVDLSYFEKKHDVQSIAIHRGVLQQILLDQLDTSQIFLNHQLQNLSFRYNNLKLNFDNGESFHSSILLGADGINSVVRNELFQNCEIRSAGQICWRGVTNFDLPTEYKNEANEAWGLGDRFGFVQIADNTVYWYALKNIGKDKDDFTVNNIAKYFGHYHPIILKLINATNFEDINTAEISDLKPINCWYKDNVCLLGDAAHATTPNMGQGACQAIEDAYVLSECLNKFNTTIAFEKYQNYRLAKSHQVVKASWRIGKMAHLSNPLIVKFRNQLMRSIPPILNRKLSENFFNLSKIQ